MEYRNTPITGVGRSSTDLVFQWQLKTKLPRYVSKNIVNHNQYLNALQKKRDSYKHYYDRSVRERAEFTVGDNVLYQRGKQVVSSSSGEKVK